MAAVAFLLSFVLLAYLVVPASLFRLIAGLTLPVRQFHKNRVAEISFAVVVCFLPFMSTLGLTWFVPPFNNHPASVRNWEKGQTRREAYRIFVAGTLRENLPSHD